MNRVVMYGAPWCAPCKSLKPLAIREASANGVAFEYVNIEEQSERAMMNGVQGVPTIMMYDENNSLVHELGPSQAIPSKVKKMFRGEL